MRSIATSIACRLCGASLMFFACNDSMEEDPIAVEEVEEKKLEVELGLSTGSAGTSLTITTRDGATPVRTDVWLYTLEGTQMQPLTGFTGTVSRRVRQVLPPATIGGMPSGLSPASTGAENGLMTDGSRSAMMEGKLV